MQVQKRNEFNNSYFTSKLFMPNGKEIKAFNMADQLNGINQMEKRGHQKTVINVEDFLSKPYNDCFGQFAQIRITNPLFGTQRITTPIFNVTYYPAKTEDYDTLLNLDYMSGYIDSYENSALRKTLTSNVKEALKQDDIERANPIIMLHEMLNKALNSGVTFSNERMRDFENIAKDMYKKILKNGIANLSE